MWVVNDLEWHTDWMEGSLRNWYSTVVWQYERRLVYGKRGEGLMDLRMWVYVWWQQMEMKAEKEQVSPYLPPVFFVFLLLLTSFYSSFSFSIPSFSSMSKYLF